MPPPLFFSCAALPCTAACRHHRLLTVLRGSSARQVAGYDGERSTEGFKACLALLSKMDGTQNLAVSTARLLEAFSTSFWLKWDAEVVKAVSTRHGETASAQCILQAAVTSVHDDAIAILLARKFADFGPVEAHVLFCKTSIRTN